MVEAERRPYLRKKGGWRGHHEPRPRPCPSFYDESHPTYTVPITSITSTMENSSSTTPPLVPPTPFAMQPASPTYGTTVTCLAGPGSQIPVTYPSPTSVSTLTITSTSTSTSPITVTATTTFTTWPATCSSTCPTSGALATITQTHTTTFSGAITQAPLTSPSNHGISPDAASQISQCSAGISIGVVVGSCIGCAAFGLIVGALALFFIMRRRKKTESPASSIIRTSPPNQGGSPSGGLAGLAAFKANLKPRTNQDPKGEEEDLLARLARLGTMIQQHVESNYHLDVIQTSPASMAETLTQQLTNSLYHDPSHLARLCLAPATRHVALRHVIATALFSAIDFRTMNNRSSLLPPVMVEMQRAMSRADGGALTPQVEHALREWQKLSLFLLHQARPHEAATTTTAAAAPIPSNQDPPAAIKPQVASLRALLDPILAPFTPTSHDERYRQSESLEDLIWEGARFGYLLLSRPDRWGSDWRVAGGREMVVVVVPGLLRFGRDGGGTAAAQAVGRPVTASAAW
ncbi:hypothetical protein B0T19DRAFT_453767 [Cercophora scortea]|uniref:Uncharacterized protein n=1 Tax=Cercophora scortea TaxID=314031 RepID=A0AAE0J4I1_9PEZI|nr:hypothetical protein B0T19DRAFT_453767 [Cercophora scortea]